MIAVVYGNLRYSDRHFSQLMCGGVLRRLSTSPFTTATEPKWSEISTRKRVVKERQYYTVSSVTINTSLSIPPNEQRSLENSQ